MKRLIFFIVLIIGQVSCGDSNRPEGLLSEDQMVQVMVDIHMAEGLAGSLPVSYDSSKKLYPMFESRVFEKHQVEDSVYRESLQYYLRDAKKMEELYGRVVDSLNVKEKTGNQ